MIHPYSYSSLPLLYQIVAFVFSVLWSLFTWSLDLGVQTRLNGQGQPINKLPGPPCPVIQVPQSAFTSNSLRLHGYQMFIFDIS
jgi:hypothetical protein